MFKTLGDKRFGCHLIVGLERLLPLMVPGAACCLLDAHSAGAPASELLQSFPESRLDEGAPGGVLRTHQHIFDFQRLHKAASYAHELLTCLNRAMQPLLLLMKGWLISVGNSSLSASLTPSLVPLPLLHGLMASRRGQCQELCHLGEGCRELEDCPGSLGRIGLPGTCGVLSVWVVAHELQVWRLGREAGQVRKIMNECGIMVRGS